MATHLGNLVKVSETVVVRRRAGEALVSIIDKMPLSQRNEIAVELGKGLEIGDYQFSKYIPDYLGVIMLHLPPGNLTNSSPTWKNSSALPTVRLRQPCSIHSV